MYYHGWFIGVWLYITRAGLLECDFILPRLVYWSVTLYYHGWFIGVWLYITRAGLLECMPAPEKSSLGDLTNGQATEADSNGLLDTDTGSYPVSKSKTTEVSQQVSKVE